MDEINLFIKKKPLWIIFGVGFLLYFYSLFNGFVGDDFDQLVNNNFIHNLAHAPYFFLGGTFNNGFTSLSGIYYKPVMTLIFSLLYSFFHASPFFYHFIQLVFHISNTVLLFYLFKKFFSSKISFIAAFIFLIHPMNTEAVVYISNLQDVLFTFFGLSGLVLLIYKPGSLKNSGIAYLFFLLSLLSKETGIVFIGVSLLYQFLYHRKLVVRHFIFTIIIVGIYAFLRINAVGLYSYHTENFPMMQLNLPGRLINIPQILLYYIKTFFFPVHLAFDQSWIVKSISIQQFFLPLIVEIFISIALIFIGIKTIKDQEKRKIYYFFFVLLVLGLGLHLQVLPLDMTVADRWFYVPMIGVLGLISLLFSEMKPLIKFQSALHYVLAGIIIIFFCLTFNRSRNWESQFTLYQHDIKYNTTSSTLLNGWASELMNKGKYDEAVPYIKQSIALNPNFCYSWNNLGTVYAVRKDYELARKYYETAIKRNACQLAYNNLGTLLYYHFDTGVAYFFTKNALKEVPASPRLWLMLALIEHKRGNDSEALKAAQRSYELSPSSASVYVISNLENHQPFDLKEQ